MDYDTIKAKIAACKDESDLFEARALLNRYRLTSGDSAGYQALQRLHTNMSRRLAKAETHTRLNY